MMKRAGKKRRISASTFVALLICAFHLIPFYIMIGVALKSPYDTSSRWVFPGYLFLDNFKEAIRYGDILKSILSNVIITGGAVVGITVIGALAAYPLARNQTKFNKGVRTFSLGMMLVPALSLLVPLYSLMVKIQGISTYWGIILVLVTFQLPTSIFLFTNFIVSIPKSLDEAAAIDGCPRLRIFFSIILPQLKPVTASVIIMTGVSCWNDYMFSLYFLQSPQIKSVTLSVASFFTQTQSNMGAAAAGALLGIVPIVALYLCLQKYFVKGMVDSAIK